MILKGTSRRKEGRKEGREGGMEEILVKIRPWSMMQFLLRPPSDDHTGSSAAKINLQTCPKLNYGAGPLCAHITSHGYIGQRCDFGQGWSQWWRAPQWGMQPWAISSQRLAGASVLKGVSLQVSYPNNSRDGDLLCPPASKWQTWDANPGFCSLSTLLLHHWTHPVITIPSKPVPVPLGEVKVEWNDWQVSALQSDH